MVSCEKKQSKGRQKIEIRRILKDSARHVTFTKRRGGLFKKAEELSLLLGADVAILAFSPGNKPFSFGIPSVLDRFISSVQPACQVASPRDATSEELQRELDGLTALVESGRKRTELLDAKVREMRSNLLGADLASQEMGPYSVVGSQVNAFCMTGFDADVAGLGLVEFDADSVTSQVDQIPCGFGDFGLLDRDPVSLVGPDMMMFPHLSYSDLGFCF